MPESSPQEVKVTDVSPSEMRLNWSPPEKPNGIIIAYEVLYQDADALFVKNTSTTNIVLSDLKPYTLYNISVRSYTRLGHGDQSSSFLSVRTSETGKEVFLFACLIINSHLCSKHSSQFPCCLYFYEPKTLIVIICIKEMHSFFFLAKNVGESLSCFKIYKLIFYINDLLIKISELFKQKTIRKYQRLIHVSTDFRLSSFLLSA